MDNRQEQEKIIILPSIEAKRFILATQLWRLPGPEKMQEPETRRVLNMILLLSPLYCHKDTKPLMERAEHAPSEEKTDILELASRAFGKGFAVHPLDEDEVLDEVLLAFFATMEEFEFKRMDRTEFHQKYYLFK